MGEATITKERREHTVVCGSPSQTVAPSNAGNAHANWVFHAFHATTPGQMQEHIETDEDRAFAQAAGRALGRWLDEND